METVEERLAKVEKDVQLLKTRFSRPNANIPDWIEAVAGMFKGNEDFKEIVRLGKEIRDADPIDGDK